MIQTATWASALPDAGYKLAAGVPCSSLGPLQNHFQSAHSFTYVAAPNEGQAVGVAAGAVMAGQRAVVLMQNSGLGNAINPLTSLVEPFRLPLLLVVSWRGQPARGDEPQHVRMGLATHAILDAIDVMHVTLHDEHAVATQQLRWAIDQAESERRCVAIVVPDGVFEEVAQPADRQTSHAEGIYEDHRRYSNVLSRTEALDLLRNCTSPGTIRLATTGKTGRELFTLSDDPSNLYVVGSMGLASSVGLGLSLAMAHHTLVVDGDGAALMHLGALPMIARYGGANLLHVILDNGSYDSTGGQASLATHAPFADIAARCGYAYAARIDERAGLERAMSFAARGPTLIHVSISGGSPPNLARPSRTPHEVLQRLQSLFGIPQ